MTEALTTTWTQDDQQRQNAHLQRILDRIQAKTSRQSSSLAIFDLDGTLFDNRPRTAYILRQIADQFEAELPQLVQAVDGHVLQDLSLIQYGPLATLDLLGVTDERERELVTEQWAKRFFTDEYQRFDLPLPGAKSFVSQVYEAGATVIYLTGRDVGMLVGLTETLRMCGFPVGVVGTMTMTKKDFNEDDGIFKESVAAYLDRLGEVVAIFENEPANSNLLQKLFPGAVSMFLLTQHRNDAPPLADGIVRIRDFRISG
ncbi:MAG: haloacid dehalogenase-like hydrolase [Myxococcales bacterium]|jgi:hypothetical protein|nr:haloacid dehalogenase-like hydrolase [Myxococcales bacterium]